MTDTPNPPEAPMSAALHPFRTRREAWAFFHLVTAKGGVVGFPHRIEGVWTVKTA